MSMIRSVRRAEVTATNDDERVITVTCSTPTKGRDDLIIPAGAFDLINYRNNPIWLFQHEPDWPVARSLEIDEDVDGKLVARVQFPPAGVSVRADEVYGLIRAGVINAASTGFDVISAEPLDPKNPSGTIIITRAELQEISFVSIPAVPDALVTERAMERLRRMANQTRTVEPAVDAERVTRLKKVMKKRGLYEVANLAYLLQELGWVHNCAEFESDIEQDASKVPAMLGGALQQVGAALVAMTQEEVEELLQGVDVDVEPAADDLPAERAARLVARFRKLTAARSIHPAPKLPAKHATRVSNSTSAHRRMANLYARELGITETA